MLEDVVATALAVAVLDLRHAILACASYARAALIERTIARFACQKPVFGEEKVVALVSSDAGHNAKD
jgi:hypothetical protein